MKIFVENLTDSFEIQKKELPLEHFNDVLLSADSIASLEEGEIKYSLKRYNNKAIIHADINLIAKYRCVRCLKYVKEKIELKKLVYEKILNDNNFIDISDEIREDIFLSLSDYPKCSDFLITKDCKPPIILKNIIKDKKPNPFDVLNNNNLNKK